MKSSSIFAMVVMVIVFCGSVLAANSISQHGITWMFNGDIATDASEEYQYGTFANGDYWITSTSNDPNVYITGISPAWDGSKHGSMVNPVLHADQGYHYLGTVTPPDGADSYNSSLNVAIGISAQNPLVLDPNDSLVSTKGLEVKGPGDSERTWLEDAAVLTVLDSAAKSTHFRPPYVGENKVRYDTAELQTDLLPKVTLTGGDYYVPGNYEDPSPGGTAIQWHVRYYQRPHIFHKYTHFGEDIRPYQNADTYYRNSQGVDSQAALILLSDSSDPCMSQLLINYIQTGIDAYYTIQTDPNPSMRAERSLSKWMIVFAGLMLDDTNLKSNHNYTMNPTYDLSYFTEDYGTYFGEDAYADPNGVDLWTGWQDSGHPFAENVLYRNAIANPDTDPADQEYEHLGWTKSNPPTDSFEAYRRCCKTMPFIGAALAARLMGAMEIWDHDAFFAYIDRWMYEDDDEWYDCDGSAPQRDLGYDFVKNMWALHRQPDINVDAPVPNPMTWATAPHATGTGSISMVATTATDPNSVQYYFNESTDGAGANDSMWQSFTDYTDIGLNPNTEYIWEVRARDLSLNNNETDWSYEQSVITDLCAIDPCPSADLTGDCFVDYEDFTQMGGQWLNGYDWNDLTEMAIQWLTTDSSVPDSMVCIPDGEFEMGNHFAPEGYSDELPVHKVLVDAFFMSQYEITNQQYCDFLNSAYPAQLKVVGGIVYASSDSGNSYPYYDTHSADTDSQIDFSNPNFSVRTKGGRDMSDDPMVEVSWYGSVAYCNWRSSAEGKENCYNLSTWECDFSKHGYRLATEAEWEYAARGGLAGKRFPWSDPNISHSEANYYAYPSGYSYDENPTEGPHPDWVDGIPPYTSVVGSFSANGYGLYDMAGNVWEWCNDWYDENYYDVSPYDNPPGPASGTNPVLRGGSWNLNATYCRVATRRYYYPDSRISYYGFRIVLDLE